MMQVGTYQQSLHEAHKARMARKKLAARNFEKAKAAKEVLQIEASPEPKPIKRLIPKPEPVSLSIETLERCDLAIYAPYLTVSAIARVVARHLGVAVAEMSEKGRQSHRVVFPRFVAYYLSRHLTEYSLSQIGSVFNKDHTTVLNGIRRMKGMMEEDPHVRSQVEEIQQEILGGTNWAKRELERA